MYITVTVITLSAGTPLLADIYYLQLASSDIQFNAEERCWLWEDEGLYSSCEIMRGYTVVVRKWGVIQ